MLYVLRHLSKKYTSVIRYELSGLIRHLNRTNFIRQSVYKIGTILILLASAEVIQIRIFKNMQLPISLQRDGSSWDFKNKQQKLTRICFLGRS